MLRLPIRQIFRTDPPNPTLFSKKIKKRGSGTNTLTSRTLTTSVLLIGTSGQQVHCTKWAREYDNSPKPEVAGWRVGAWLLQSYFWFPCRPGGCVFQFQNSSFEDGTRSTCLCGENLLEILVPLDVVTMTRY